MIPNAASLGKVVWVTGGAGYLGSAIVGALDAAGVTTLCFDLPGRAEATIADRRLNHTVAVSCDLSDLEAQREIVGRMMDKYGVPDGVAHLTFASSSGKRVEELSTDDFSRTLTASLTPTFDLCRQVGARMAERGHGSVVLFSSMYGVVSPDPGIYLPPMTPNPIDYGTAKAGLLQMMRYLSVHFGASGVRFNCVTPGPFPNPGVQKAHPEFVDRLRGKTALHRVGRNHEIVGPTLFLLSEGSSFVTGHSLAVDGGWTAW